MNDSRDAFNIIRRRALSRRTMLRGLGAALAMPLMDSMMTGRAAAASKVGGAAGAGESLLPIRSAFIYVPNGIFMEKWTPDKVGADYALPSILEPLAPVKSDVMVLSGLAQNNAFAHGDGAGDHARSGGTFLTGVHVRKTSGKDIHAGVSIDQVIAMHRGSATRLPSLEIGCEPGRQAGNCDSGYSCAYSSNIAWRTPAMPMAKEIDPRQVFNRLFGDPDQLESKRQAAEQASMRRSVLDLVREDAASLRTQLGSSDRRKLDEYLDSVRDIERRVQNTEATNRDHLPPHLKAPEGIPADYADHIRLMYDLMALAFRTDTTRVVTFMHANCGSNRSYRNIGVDEGHHSLSHHGGDPVKLEKLRIIDRFHIQEHARFLAQLKGIREGDGSLLDRCMIVYGCGIADGNRHNHNDLPILLSGRGGGTIDSGRHVRYDRDTPLCNLFLSMLDRTHVQLDRFGDSTERLSHLTV